MHVVGFRMQLLRIAALSMIYFYYFNYVLIQRGETELRMQIPEDWRGFGFPGAGAISGSYREFVKQFTWVLGTELLSSARAVHVLSHFS